MGEILEHEVRSIHSRYHIIEKLGEGASAEVFLVEDSGRKGHASRAQTAQAT